MSLKNVVGGLTIIAGSIGAFTHAVISHGENGVSNEFVTKYPAVSFVFGMIGGYIAVVGSDYSNGEKLGVGVLVAILTTVLTPFVALGVWNVYTDGEFEELQQVMNDDDMDRLTFYQKLEFVEDDIENIVIESE